MDFTMCGAACPHCFPFTGRLAMQTARRDVFSSRCEIPHTPIGWIERLIQGIISIQIGLATSAWVELFSHVKR